jgi:DNA invertase Pin-like site-specific DNA recombinase
MKLTAEQRNIVLKVCCYYRMSSDDQTASIAQQMKEVRAYARQRGWEIVIEYTDSGLSGSKDVEKRIQFHRMIADSAKKEWQAILCYDVSRFARLDSIAAGRFKEALRKNGVHLETCREGRIDWTTRMGRLTDALLSESASEYSEKLSSSVLRGRIHALESGNWPHGVIPYGYSRQLLDGTKEVMVVPRTEIFRKPKHWKLKLIPNESEAAIVLRIFTEYARRDISLHQLLRELGDTTSPSGQKGWRLVTLISLMKNPVYAGDMSIGCRGFWTRGAFNQAESQVKKDSWPAIVSRELWETVQQKIKASSLPMHRSPHKNGGVLSGILICGNCGHRLSRVKPGRYVCSSRNNAPAYGCRFWGVSEATILPALLKELATGVDAAKLEAIEAKPKAKKNPEAADLRKQKAELERKIKRGTDNLLLAAPDLFPQLQKNLLSLKADLVKVSHNLKAVEAEPEKGGEAGEFFDWLTGAYNRLVEVRESPLMAQLAANGTARTSAASLRRQRAIRAEAEDVRGLLKALETEITLTWEPKGKRTFRLTKAVLRANFAVKELETCRRMNTDAPPAGTSLKNFNRSSPRRSSSARPAASAPPSV